MIEVARAEPSALQPMEEPQLLGRLQEAFSALQAAHTIVEAKSIRAAIHAIDTWAKVRSFSNETQRKSNEVKLRADYHFGLFLKQQEKSKGGDPSLYSPHAGGKNPPASRPPTLKEMGINKDDAKKCQRLAGLSESKLEGIIQKAAAAGEKLTTDRAAKLAVKASRPEPTPAPPLPEGKFSLIYADPPWQDDFERGTSRDIEAKYRTMPLAEIKKEPVSGLCAKDCVLFLWARSPMLPQALEVLAEWGFEFKTSAVWAKEGAPGQGFYFRQDHEILLVGTRGHPGVPTTGNRPSSIIDARKGRHSEKPAVVRTLLESMYPDAKRVELFARETVPGWTPWGNEVSP